jgi:hypothetical protein
MRERGGIRTPDGSFGDCWLTANRHALLKELDSYYKLYTNIIIMQILKSQR